MRKGGRHRVVVAVNAHEGERVGPPALHPAGLERAFRKLEHRVAVFLQALGLGRTLAPKASIEVHFAAPGQVRVQLGERFKGPDGNEEVPPSIADEVLDVALLVAPCHPAEPMGEQKVALEPQELARERPLVRADDPCDRDGGVVVGGLGRDAAEDLECGDVAGREGLGALARIGGDEKRIRVRQRHHRECGLHSHACDLDRRLTELELGLAGWLAQAARRPRRSLFDTQRRSGGP